MSNYIYEDPLENGYTKLSISSENYNSLAKLKSNKLKIFEKNEYYLSPDSNSIIVDKSLKKIIVLFIILMAPFILMAR